MKRLLSIILIIFCCETLYSQQITLDFCVGTWEYKNPATGEEFMMKLKKFQYAIPKGLGGGMEDCLVGSYIYKKNEVILTDCMAQLDESKMAADYPILILYFDTNTGYLDMAITDFNMKNGYGYPKVIGMPSKITLHSVFPKQIKVEVIPDRQGEAYIDNKQRFPYGTTLPLEMILTKVE